MSSGNLDLYTQRSTHCDNEVTMDVLASSTSQTVDTACEQARQSIDITDMPRQSVSETSRSTTTELIATSPASDSSKSIVASKGEAPSKPIARKTSGKERRVFRSWWWWWELGAASLNVSCMCLVVATLLAMENKPLSYWHLKISPNAVIAVLTTVAKTALLVPVAECISQFKWSQFHHSNPLSDLQIFDDASRGPWGAYTFLCKHFPLQKAQRKSTLFASLGCLITLLSLAFEPTAQQILSFPVRTVEVTGGTASIVIATKVEFDLGFEGSILEGVDDRTPISHEPPVSIQLATFTGLINGTIRPDAKCSTPYCQFGDIKTLGLCAKCDDITRKLTRNCTHHPDQILLVGAYYPNDSWNCTFRTEEPIPRSVGDMTLYITRFNDLPLMNVLASVGATWNHHKNRRGGFTTLRRKQFEEIPKFYNMEDTISFNETVATEHLVESHTCFWEWCERTYTNFTIVNGEFQHGVVDIQPLVHDQTKQTETNWDTWDYWEGTYEITTNDSSPPRVYSIDLDSELSMFSYMTTLLHKNLSQGIFAPPDPFLQILHHQDIHATAHNMAMSLSNALRSAVNLNATTLTGTALQQEVFVAVQWEWLVVPISLTIGSVALLVACMILSDAGQAPLLKSSALATLFHGAAGFSHADMRPPAFEDSEALTDKTQSMKAQLRCGADGIMKFEKVD